MRSQTGIILSCVLMLGAGCTLIERSQITGMLNQQAKDWNAGDIDAFMVPYWHSPDLTFSSGGKVTRGWQATLDRYRQRYPTRETMGRLTFSDLEVSLPGSNVALVLGRWRLERAEPIGGGFTLVLERRNRFGNWVIIHDHTSLDAP